jgi:hypothetical protein
MEGFILAHSSRVQSIMAGMPRWQELEADSHVESAVRKKRADECLCSAAFLLFMQSRTQTQGIVPLSFKVSFPTSISLVVREL